MPTPIPFPVRQALVHAYQQGDVVATLARRFHLAARTVRRLVRQAQHAGHAQPPGYRRGPRGSLFPDAVVTQARALRAQHPGWGAGLIRLTLGQHFPAGPLPCVHTIRRWLAHGGLVPARPGRPPAAYQRASQVHLVWQADAADQMPLATGQLVSWLRVVDECSGAVLRTVVFPLGLQPSRRRAGASLPARPVRRLGPAGGAAAG